jgi:hypothetical protein
MWLSFNPLTEIDMLNAAYDQTYASTLDHIDYVVKSLAEKPGRALSIAISSGGDVAVQALFDAVMDKGHRMVLVQALDAPSLPGWVREKLEIFLYGTSRQTAALFSKKVVL